MSVIVFWYDDHTMSVYWDPSPADQVAEAINSGNSSLDPGWIPGYRWRAASQGEFVFATAAPGEENRMATRGVPHLTGRERDVLVGLVEGLTIKDIARKLNVRPRTITEHTWSIRKKLGTQTRDQAIGRAMRLGLIKPRRKPEGDLPD
jgi:LuxR family maltose regulon positive regulatory protein